MAIVSKFSLRLSANVSKTSCDWISEQYKNLALLFYPQTISQNLCISPSTQYLTLIRLGFLRVVFFFAGEGGQTDPFIFQEELI